MNPALLLIALIIQPRPPQMLCTDGVKKRRHPILHDHCIIGMSRFGESKAIPEFLAASARHRQPNPAGVRVRLCQGLLQFFDYCESQCEHRFRCLTVSLNDYSCSMAPSCA